MKKNIIICIRIIIAFVVIFSLFLLSNLKVVGNFEGDSMLPTIKGGDILLLQKVDSEKDFKVGDVLAYQFANGEHIVHRYIGILNISCGIDWCQNKTFYKFKGDNNLDRDYYLIELEDIKYKLLWIIK